MATPQAPAAKLTPKQINDYNRALIIANGVDRSQQVFSQTIATPGTTNNVVNITPRFVGLIKRFLVKVSATVTNNDGALNATLTDLGLSNLFSQVVFVDLNNNTRIQTAGWHLMALSSVKNQYPWLNAALNTAAYQVEGYGNNFPITTAASQINHGTNSVVQAYFEVPLAYSDTDLRGAVYANVINATMNLQLTINPAPFTAAGTDSTFSVYKGVTAANMTLTNVTITVYQEYIDQIPYNPNNGQVVLPTIDLSTVYEIKNTNFNSFTVGQDFPIPYANYRDFLSTLVVYNSDASADSGRKGGSDLNYWELQSANFTNLWKLDPQTQALRTRKLLWTDLPLGMYYFSSRIKPINTANYGNMQLIFNPITAAATAYANVGWEDFALINVLSQAGSLAG